MPGEGTTGSSRTCLRKRDRYGHGVVAAEAGVAEAGPGRAGGHLEPIEAHVGEAVDVEVLADLVDRERAGEQLGAVTRVHAVEARPLHRWRRDAKVDLACARLAEHLGELLLGGAPNDRVVDDHEPLAGDVLAQRVELHADRPRSELLARCDEAPSDVAVLDDPLAERDPAAAREALGRRYPGLGHAHHHVGVDWCLLGELLADVDASLVDALVVEARVGTGEVDELEEAELGVDALVGERHDGAWPLGIDDHHLAGEQLPHEVRTHDVEGGALGREHPSTVFELAEAQGPEAVRVAHADHPRLIHDHEGERALEPGQDLGERPFEVGFAVARELVAQLVADELRDQIGVARDGAGQHPRLGREGLGVGEVAVVAEREVGLAWAVGGLRVAPGGRAGGGVAAVADGEVPGEAGERAVVEHRGDQPLVLDDEHLRAVAHGHAGRLLPAVLQGEEAEVRQVSDGLAGSVDAEDAARLLRGVVDGRVVEVLGGRHTTSVPGGWASAVTGRRSNGW